MGLQPLRPILVTGSIRSGSTWVGRMIASHPQVTYLSEPMNPGTSRAPIRFSYPFVTQQNRAAIHAYLGKVLTSPDSAVYQLSPSRFWLWPVRYIRDRWRNLRGCRPLMKDPTAFFSTEWLTQTFDMQIIILIRHPAAFVSSMKRLGWRIDFRDFLAQPEMMDALFRSFQDEIERAAYRSFDLIDGAMLYWRMVHATVLRYMEAHPDWIFSRHEDLSLHPVWGYCHLLDRLGLSRDFRVIQAVEKHTSPRNPREAGRGVVHQLERDSRANIWSWTYRLTPSETARIRGGTEDVAHHFYTPADWEPSTERTWFTLSAMRMQFARPKALPADLATGP